MQSKKYRQGDVLFVQVRTLPDGKQSRRKNGHILEGEATGHVHRVAELDAAEVLEIGDGLFVNVTAEGGVSIVHEEHKPLSLPADIYKVRRQQEYTPEARRYVRD
jgi:hypothetical protein